MLASHGPVAAADGPAPSATAPGDGFTQAQDLFHARRYADAISLLDQYVVAHPRDARAIVLRGDARSNLGDNQAALRDYNTALGIAPDYQYGYVTRCETRVELDDLAGALADCNEGVRLNPADALAYEDRGDVQFQREAYELARADYDKAIELGRASAYVFAARCDTERLAGQRERAAADCEKALTIDPKSRRGLWSRGRLALTSGRYTDAIADLNAYIAQQPAASSTAYYFRGFAYNRLRSYKLALEDLRTYVQRAPKDADGYRERGIALYGTGERAAALADFETAERSYRLDADTAAAERVAAMSKAVRAAQPLVP